MTFPSQILVYDAQHCEDDDICAEVEHVLLDAGFRDPRAGHHKLCITCPADDVPYEITSRISDLLDEEFGSPRVYPVPESGDRTILINLEYQDEHQVISAAVDADQWAAMVNKEWPADHALNDAIAALYREVEIFPSYVFGSSLVFLDQMEKVVFFDPAQHQMWSPAFWDPEEPMTEVTLMAYAQTAKGDDVMMRLPGQQRVQVTVPVPERLAKDMHKTDAWMPEAFRTWKAMGGRLFVEGQPRPSPGPTL